MAKFDPEYLRGLDELLNGADDTNEDETIATDDIVESDITIDDVRSREQTLLYLVVDKSSSIYNNGLQDEVVNALKGVQDLINYSAEGERMKNAITIFDSTINMQQFVYGNNINICYEANGKGSRLYDAITMSAQHMLKHYDDIGWGNLVKGVMLIITDGVDEGSQIYTEDDVKNALQQLNERGITVFMAKFKKNDLSYFAEKFPYIKLENFKFSYELINVVGFHTRTIYHT